MSDGPALKTLKQSTVLNKSCYGVIVRWSSDEVTLQNIFLSSLVQLKLLETRLAKDTDLRQPYVQTIRDNFAIGYVIKAQIRNENEHQPGREWYLPQNRVLKPNEPSNVRKVLKDASKLQGVSLNKVPANLS